MNFRPVFLLFFIFNLVFSPVVSADTIHLKNRRVLEGVVEREDAGQVEVRLGYGTVTLSRGEIDRIERSNPEETQKLWQKWTVERKALEERAPEDEKIRLAREKERERSVAGELARLRSSADSRTAIRVDAHNERALVNVLLNGKVRAKLVLDSGASIVLLSRAVAEKLEVDTERIKKGVTQVADGRAVETALFELKTLKVQDIGETSEEPGVEAGNVEACVILADPDDATKDPRAAVPDGLLGMSFLKKFKVLSDYKDGKIYFEKPGQDV